jgi:hypothetical protein
LGERIPKRVCKIIVVVGARGKYEKFLQLAQYLMENMSVNNAIRPFFSFSFGSLFWLIFFAFLVFRPL